MIRRSRPASRREVRVFGLDASLNSSGYAYRGWDGEIITGTINPGKRRGTARLWFNLCNLERLLDELQIDEMIIEGYAMGIRGGRVFDIGEWGGVARLAAWRRKIRIVTVTPSTLKYIVSGSGSPGKEKLQKAVRGLYGVDTTQPDELDALGLMAVGEARYGRGNEGLIQRLNNPRDRKKPGVEVEEGMR